MRSTAFLGVATHTMRPSGSFAVLQPSLPSFATLPGGGPLQAQHARHRQQSPRRFLARFAGRSAGSP